MSDLFPETMTTERLRLERCCSENVDVFELYRRQSPRHSDSVVEEFEYLAADPHWTVGSAHEYLREVEEQWDGGVAATYVVRPRDGEDGAGELAGTATVTPHWDRRTAFTGVWLRKPFWGRGYSGERVGALLALAFDRLDLELVSPGHFVGNENSRRAIEKYVDRFGGQFDCLLRNWVPIDDEVFDLRRYTISREQYEASGESGAILDER